jgi:serine/threonine-protein kinase
MDTDRNLLFGVLALQADLIDQGQFVEACTLWTTRKGVSLADVLVERGWIQPADRGDVDRLLERKLKKHGGNVKAGLAEVTGEAVRRALSSVADADVRSSLADLPGTPELTGVPTSAYVPEARDRYTLTHLHATGGIGRVWLARDSQIGRDVALKELRPERSGSPAAANRFVTEARVTGQLEHPGVVPVYELARRPGQQPFYTMRFLKGRTLTEASRAYHQKRAAGQDGALELNGLLTAFVGVCNAVAYAHSRGVIHRDLKGQNVVLGDYGEVIVLDWGLAKVVGQAEGLLDTPPVVLGEAGRPEATVAGQVIGTPGYMSPEQAAGRVDLVDCRSDVYGLGAILYEILTGRPPFQGGSRNELLRRVREEKPARPRQAPGTARPDLEAVCLKALAKDPAERYASAKELAEEVQRWLADEPVRAYPEPASARLRRWARRHRPLVAGAAALLVTAVAALAVSTVMIHREQAETEQARARAVANAAEARKQRDVARRQRSRAEAHAREAHRQKDVAKGERRRAQANAARAARQRDATQIQYRRAEKNFRQARAAVDQMLSAVGARELANIPHMEKLRRRLLQRALRFYERFFREQGQNRGVQQDTLWTYIRLADLQRKLGNWEEARKLYRQGFGLLKKVTANFTTRRELWYEFTVLCHNYALLFHDTGRFREAAVLYRTALTILEKLSAAYPFWPVYRRDLASTCVALGELLTNLGRTRAAEKFFRRGVATSKGLATVALLIPHFRFDTGRFLTKLADFLVRTGRHREAEKRYRQAEAIYKDLVGRFPKENEYRYELSVTYNNLAILLDYTSRHRQAEKAYRQAVALLEKLVSDFPATPHYRRDLGNSWLNLGVTLQARGRKRNAEHALRRAITLLEQLVVAVAKVPDYHWVLAQAYTRLGDFLGTTENPREAQQSYDRAVAVCRQLMKQFPKNPSYRYQISVVANNRANILRALGKFAQAEKAYREAVQILANLVADYRNLPHFRRDLANTYRGLGETLTARNRVAEAAKPLGQSIKLWQGLVDQFPEVSNYKRGLIITQAQNWLCQGNHAEAARTALGLPRISPPQVADLYNAACLLARCMPAAQKDDKLTPDQRDLTSQGYGDQAMKWLRLSVSKGFATAVHLKTDADLKPLHARDDFKKLLAELEKKNKKGGE